MRPLAVAARRLRPQIPSHKVKLVVGPGGEKIKWIQKKSKCRIQVRAQRLRVAAGAAWRRVQGHPNVRAACTALERPC